MDIKCKLFLEIILYLLLFNNFVGTYYRIIIKSHRLVDDVGN